MNAKELVIELQKFLADYKNGCVRYDGNGRVRLAALYEAAEKASKTDADADHIRANISAAGHRYDGDDKQSLVTHYLQRAIQLPETK